jgi:hypothetical protein
MEDEDDQELLAGINITIPQDTRPEKNMHDQDQ